MATKQLHMSVGQVIEVYIGSPRGGNGPPELAFYVPVEARNFVQLGIEKRGMNRVYFLRATSAGNAVGGLVERGWLSFEGTQALDTMAETRIQDAVRAAPWLITVK